jgi:hypothetical protein
MKRLLVLCLIIFHCLGAKSQEQNEYADILQYIPYIPKAQTYSSDSIAQYIQLNYKTDKERLSAIYGWVITNIRYDKDSMYHINWTLYPEEKIAATLRRKKGVCENYAALFTDISIKCGFRSFVVNGYTRQSGSVNGAGHSWCAVSLQDEWYLCDPTWDAGSNGRILYYLVSPRQFIQTHMPFDPLWQLLPNSINDQEFRKGFFNLKSDNLSYSIKDSINAFFQLDSLQQMEAAASRVKRSGVDNERVKNWLAYNRMQIAIVYGEKDMDLYNAAVADLNKANSIFNEFIQYRNKGFMPYRPDAKIKSMLNPISILLSSAELKLNQLGQKVENFQYDTGTIKDRIGKLKVRMKDQQHFLNRYLATNEKERIKLFYQ